MCTQIEIDISAIQKENAVVGDVVITRTRPLSTRNVSKLLYVVDVPNSQIMLHQENGVVLADTGIAVDEIRDRLHAMKIDDAMFSVIVA